MTQVVEKSSGRYHRAATNFCEICKQPTSERKPYCIDHINKSPYIDTIMAQLKRREKEEKAVKKQGAKAVKSDSVVVGEILTTLRAMGPRTVPDLARDLNMKKELLHSYVDFLILNQKIVAQGIMVRL